MLCDIAEHGEKVYYMFWINIRIGGLYHRVALSLKPPYRKLPVPVKRLGRKRNPIFDVNPLDIQISRFNHVYLFLSSNNYMRLSRPLLEPAPLLGNATGTIVKAGDAPPRAKPHH